MKNVSPCILLRFVSNEMSGAFNTLFINLSLLSVAHYILKYHEKLAKIDYLIAHYINTLYKVFKFLKIIFLLFLSVLRSLFKIVTTTLNRMLKEYEKLSLQRRYAHCHKEFGRRLKYFLGSVDRPPHLGKSCNTKNNSTNWPTLFYLCPQIL